ncbi:hypothetical protein SLS56_011820 [Neofusicoccum ribis]|uniref:Beta-xylanase n=1 Tax=Neofusicoccum ribis TaxID=45134 RepID=A0ABR3SAK3_9PEZI
MLITPANAFKFESTEPLRNVFNWTQSDEFMNLALENGQIRRCHNLVWRRALPGWLTSQSWSREELMSILENHIRNVVTKYEGKCYAWDVANEAFHNNGTWQSHIWYDTIGPEYVEFAFKTARKYTTAKLYYNDDNMTDINPKVGAVRSMILNFQANGVPIDGVGIEGHETVGKAPDYTAMLQTMHYFAFIPNLEIAITELDVGIPLPSDEAKLEQQAEVYANVVAACQKVGACVGVTVWDFWDTVSWVPSSRPGLGDAQLFWPNLTAKPAYYRIAEVLQNAADLGSGGRA